MSADITTLPPRDPIFALAPELKLHLSDVDGQLVVNSREVARVFFHHNHRCLLAFLCFGCIEKRLCRQLTQGDLIVCASNAGWDLFRRCRCSCNAIRARSPVAA
jgi:hypothetical protein